LKPILLSMRPSVTRTSRHDPRGAALESVAAEFALLAQRRARLARQLDSLGRQLAAASSSLDAVQNRMSLLAHRMDGIDPTLRPAAVDLPAPAPPAPVRKNIYGRPMPPSPAQFQPAPKPVAEAAPARLPGLPRGMRPVLRRRPFLPE
jgi:hypothetical protein